MTYCVDRVSEDHQRRMGCELLCDIVPETGVCLDKSLVNNYGESLTEVTYSNHPHFQIHVEVHQCGYQ